MIRKIGLTGGIASGKSRVAQMLAARLDCAHMDADEICRQLLQPHAVGWREFSSIFGARYIGEDGGINRPLLRQDLFADEELRRKMNNMLHPLVKKTISRRMARILADDPGSRVLVEVPLLYEVGWENLFDTVVVVYADYATCISRLMERDGADRTTAARELESQLPLSEKARRGDHVIDNSGMLPETERQVEQLAALLKTER